MVMTKDIATKLFLNYVSPIEGELSTQGFTVSSPIQVLPSFR